jgi:hypothetical protein
MPPFNIRSKLKPTRTLIPSLFTQSGTTSILLTLPHLLLAATWIRDDLDPLVAREGPEALPTDALLLVHELLGRLRRDAIAGNGQDGLGAEELRASRICCAVLEMAASHFICPHRYPFQLLPSP